MKQSHYSILAFLSVLALLALAIPLPAQALSVEELRSIEPTLTAEQAKTLLTTGSLSRYLNGHDTAQLVPDCSVAAGVRADMSSVAYTTGVETLYLSKDDAEDTPETMLRWYNALRSISTLKGVKYYDLLSGTMQTLFSQSYAVDSLTDRKRIPDPLVTSLPAESTITIMQDDSRFGSNYYRVRYRTAPGAISMTMTNLTALKVLFFSVVAPSDMQMHLVVLPWKGERLFYGSVVAKASTMLGLGGMVREAFHNRVVALYGWFSKLAAQLRD